MSTSVVPQRRSSTSSQRSRRFSSDAALYMSTQEATIINERIEEDIKVEFSFVPVFGRVLNPDQKEASRLRDAKKREIKGRFFGNFVMSMDSFFESVLLLGQAESGEFHSSTASEIFIEFLVRKIHVAKTVPTFLCFQISGRRTPFMDSCRILQHPQGSTHDLR